MRSAHRQAGSSAKTAAGISSGLIHSCRSVTWGVPDRHICPPDHPHDDNHTCYSSHKCRCTACTRHNTEGVYFRRHMKLAGRYKPRTVLAVGTIRRLRALALNGYGQQDLAERVGTTQAQISRWILCKELNVERRYADRVAQVFRELWDKPGPSKRARLAAQRRHYMPALAWDDIDNPCETPNVVGDGLPIPIDEVVVELAMAGQRPELNPHELRECIRQLHALHWSDLRIADHLGVKRSQAEYLRAQMELQAWGQDEAVVRWRPERAW